MLCGCYEAVAAESLITSDKQVLRDYFNEAVFVRIILKVSAAESKGTEKSDCYRKISV